MKRLLVLLFCFGSLAAEVAAQDLRAYVARERLVLAAGETLELVVEAAAPAPAGQPVFPRIAGFRQGRRRQETSGGYTRYIQAYEPLREGIFEVPIHTYRLGKRQYVMEGFTVRVGEVTALPEREPSPGRAATRPAEGPSLAAGPPQLYLSLSDQPALARLPQRLDLWLSLPAVSAYVPSEALRAAAAAQLATLPYAQETVALARPLRQVRGQRQEWLLYRSYLLPPDSGTLTLGPVSLSLPSGEAVTAPALRRAIRPLPPTALPQALNPGYFYLSARLPKTRYMTGEVIPLEIVAGGSGALPGLPVPQLALPAGFGVRDPQLALDLSHEDSLLSGKKTYFFDLRAAFPGHYPLGPARLYVYDLATARYDSIFSPVLTVEVRGDSLPQLVGRVTLDRFYQEALANATPLPPRRLAWPPYLPLICLILLLAAWGLRTWRRKPR